MSAPRYPALYQINTRVWLTELSQTLGRRATLDDIPEAALQELAGLGFDWVWLLGVWQTGPAGRALSRADPDWRHDFEETLPDLTDDDIGGSCFAITDYRVHEDLGGDAALARVRERLREHGLRLMLDFVPNHLAPDHPWVNEHPDYFIAGGESDLQRAPEDFVRISTSSGPQVFAHGRDPYFPGWPDTLQLDYGNPALQEAMVGELTRIAGQCDGLRCDMAMLVLPEIFERTWGIRSPPFWPRAITRIRERHPGFLFLAEVYWDLGWTLQQEGFDYCYDKRLYDRLRDGQAAPVRAHLGAELDYQERLARFLENHDEPRAAATFRPSQHRAAALITYLVPGLRFFHQGQLEGRRKHLSPHLVRAPVEPVDPGLAGFYTRLLTLLRHPVLREGFWKLLDCRPAWDGNWTHETLIAFAWEAPRAETLLVAVNFAPHQTQGRIPFPWPVAEPPQWRLEDLLNDTVYVREGPKLASPGLYVDLPPWGAHVFSIGVAP